MKRLVNKLVIALLVFSFYMLYSGVMTGLTLLTGIIIAVAVAALADRALTKRELSLRDAVRLTYLAKYLAFFILEELKEHAILTRLILSPRISVAPDIVSFPVDLDSDYALTLLAHTITNTPGTVTVYVDRERKIFYVHWLLPRSRDPAIAKKAIVGHFERLAKAVFD